MGSPHWPPFGVEAAMLRSRCAWADDELADELIARAGAAFTTRRRCRSHPMDRPASPAERDPLRFYWSAGALPPGVVEPRTRGHRRRVVGVRYQG